MLNYKLYYLVIIQTAFLAFSVDPFRENISIAAKQPIFHFLLVLNNLLLASLLYQTVKKVGQKRAAIWLFFSCLSVVILPFRQPGEIISELHVLIAYLAFTIVTAVILKTVWEFRLIDHKEALKLFKIFFVSAFIFFVLYAKYLLINSILELLYILTICLIMLRMEGHYSA